MTAFNFGRLDVISLNVRGLRDIVKRKALFLFIKQREAQVILFQETHSCDTDLKFWKSQWGDTALFCHGTNHSAGVAIFLNKLKGDIVETIYSGEGRWIIVILNIDNVKFIICNVYGYNSISLNSCMFKKLSLILLNLKSKYKDAYLLIGGDFNETPNDSMDRLPPRNSTSKVFELLCDDLQVTDVWRFLHPHDKDYTWSNNALTHKSRIDFWLLSSNAIHFILDTLIVYAPLSDHKLISISLVGNTNSCKRIRGYWKFNNKLLSDAKFIDCVKNISYILEDESMSHVQRWEFYKFKVRQLAMRRGKEIKLANSQRCQVLLDELEKLLSKEILSIEEEIHLSKLRNEIDDFYLDLAKGAFIRSRAKWLEMGEKNTSYFFALEKRNIKRNSVTALKIDDNINKNPAEINKYVHSFFNKLYSSNYNVNYANVFLQKVKPYIPVISNEFKMICENDLTLSELTKAMHSMKKGKSPGSDGLTIEFYTYFWEIIKKPLIRMYNECIANEELSTSMKQGLITLIPKPDKDLLSHLIIGDQSHY